MPFGKIGGGAGVVSEANDGDDKESGVAGVTIDSGENEPGWVSNSSEKGERMVGAVYVH